MLESSALVAIVYTRHAREKLAERKIDESWVERTVLDPDRYEPDPVDPTLTRLFRSVPERRDQVLRVVVCFESSERCRVITALLDRDA